MRRFWSLAALLWLSGAVVAALARDYDEPYRPQLHYSPPAQWMNDPNGAIYLDGEYHLFFQHYPYGNRWGPMHWGHAVSRDLVHWQTLPIALAPDALGSIFSGSIVYDSANRSGLGRPGQPPLVALFTHHDLDATRPGGARPEAQSVAYSLDRGRSWTKYAGNPVLANPGLLDFRDPQVSWFEPTQRWIMTLTAGDHVAFYASKDLLHWQHESDFGAGVGEHNGVWECPGLVHFTVRGERTQRDVLLVSVTPGAPNGGSGTQYFVGSFDGHRFRLEPSLAAALRMTPAVFPAGERFEDFSGDLAQWSVTGEAFAIERGPTGAAFLQSYAHGPQASGIMRSREFRISQPYLNFKLGGGRYPGSLGVHLRVDGELVLEATGDEGNTREQLGRGSWNSAVRNVGWDVRRWRGRAARFEIVDQVSAEHGYAVVGPIVFADAAAAPAHAAARWLDYGADNYAGVTWSGVPRADGRTLFIGWMSNWAYAQDVPTERWRSAMTLARELSLVRGVRGLEVHSRPVAELARLRRATVRIGAKTVAAERELAPGALPASGLADLEFLLDPRAANRIGLTLANDAGETLRLNFDRGARRVELDRTHSGAVGFSHAFATPQVAPWHPTPQHMRLRIILDRASIEVFIDDGATVLTSTLFPSAPYRRLSLGADAPVRLRSGTVSELGSIWDDGAAPAAEAR